MTVQPIENVRDYYGSQPAMYFEFLRSYTNSLVWVALLGLLTLVGHFFNGAGPHNMDYPPTRWP